LSRGCEVEKKEITQMSGAFSSCGMAKKRTDPAIQRQCPFASQLATDRGIDALAQIVHNLDGLLQREVLLWRDKVKTYENLW